MLHTAKKLGEQCFYDETCQYNDENSLCVQVRHNAMCQCASGFHSVSYTKPTRRVFCTQGKYYIICFSSLLVYICILLSDCNLRGSGSG